MNELQRNAISEIEKALLELPQLEQELGHYFIDGVYVRSLKIPKGTGITGKIHKTEHISILAEGTLRLFDGEQSQVVTAPFIAVTKAGTKKVGYAETDCTFINVIRTDKKELPEIEQEAVCDTWEQYKLSEVKQCHLQAH